MTFLLFSWTDSSRYSWQRVFLVEGSSSPLRQIQRSCLLHNRWWIHSAFLVRCLEWQLSPREVTKTFHFCQRSKNLSCRFPNSTRQISSLPLTTLWAGLSWISRIARVNSKYTSKSHRQRSMELHLGISKIFIKRFLQSCLHRFPSTKTLSLDLGVKVLQQAESICLASSNGQT